MDDAAFQQLVEDNLAAMSVEADVDVAYTRQTGPEIVLGRAQATYMHTVRPLFLPSFDIGFDTDVTFPQAT